MKKVGECCKVVECDSGIFVSFIINLNFLVNGGGIYIKNFNGGSQFVILIMFFGGILVFGLGGIGNKVFIFSMCLRLLFKIKVFNFLYFGLFKVLLLFKLCIILF